MEERSKEPKQAKMADQSSIMENLPSHILMEIISRLPIKTVMAIRSVCKSLLSLVSDSHFQMLHSTIAPTELLIHGCGKSSTTLSIAEYVFVDDSLTDVDMVESNVVFELPNFSVLSDNNCNFGATQTKVSLVNSCCGLVCYKGPSSNRFAVVCNPFTREYITFPCPARVDKTIANWSICYGFGFSPEDNSFKLLRLIERKYVDTDSGEEKRIRTVGEVYTFGESGSSWRRVANRPYLNQSLLVAREPIFHEGTLYWYCTSDNAMLTFDFDTELFGELETPPRMCDVSSYKARWSLAMGVLEDCLYAAGSAGDCLDIWALKEYDQDSWGKVFSIREDVNSFSESREQFRYWQTDQVLMFKKFGGIVCFNPDTGNVKHLDGLYGRNETVFIRPSLVSLKVLLGDNVKVHRGKPWDRTKVAAIPRVWTSSEDTDSQGCMAGSSAPRSSSEASASTSHATEENVKEDLLPAILESQQGGADVGSFVSQDPWSPKDRLVGISSSEAQKLSEEIETLKAEDERKGKAIEVLNAENDRQGKAIAKLERRKKKDRAFMRFMYQQMLKANPNMPACPMPDDSSSTDDDSV